MGPPPISVATCSLHLPSLDARCSCSGCVSVSSGRSQASSSNGGMVSWKKIMRTAAYLVLFSLSVHILLSYVANVSTSGEEESSANHPPLASELCQYLELKDTGVEGQVDASEYQLRGLAVVFRHGERSPIVKDDLSKHHDCGPFRDTDRRNFDDFMKILDSDEFKMFLKVDSEFKNQPLYPLRSECSPGNMTAEGALQLSRLGNHLRKAYENSNIFSAEKRLEVKVTASPFRRTFQSAVAFISSFIFPIKGLVNEVFIKYSNETFHCTDSFCQCPKAFEWRAVYEKQHLQYFLDDTSGLKEKAQRIFKNIDATKNSSDPFSMMDVILGRYVCRRYPLPCTKDGECVSYQLLQEMLEYTSQRGLDMFNSGNDFIAARLITAEAQSILGYVARLGDELIDSPDGANRITILSGHDTTIGPVLRALRIPFVDFPRYAAHIVFEIYRSTKGSKNDLFIRLLYNGQDRTPELPFCTGKSMCEMSSLTRFARSGIFATLGFSNVTELCDPSLTPRPNNAYV